MAAPTTPSAPTTPLTMLEACRAAIHSMPADGKKISFEYPDRDRTFSDPYLFAILCFKRLSHLLFRDTLRLWPSRSPNVHLHWRPAEQVGETQHGYTSIETVYGRRLVSITLNLELMVLGNWEGDILAALVHHMAHAYFLVCCGYREPLERLPRSARPQCEVDLGGGAERAWLCDSLSSLTRNPCGGGSKHSHASEASDVTVSSAGSSASTSTSTSASASVSGSEASSRTDFSFASSILPADAENALAPAPSDYLPAPRGTSHDLTHDITYCTLLHKIETVLDVPAFNCPNFIHCAPLRAMRPAARKPVPWCARQHGRSYCDWNAETLDFPLRDVQHHYARLLGEGKQGRLVRRSQSELLSQTHIRPVVTRAPC
ncbi:hypothetical protein KEM52_006316 [Ascosphaera acerosa]|nr:hypothetical protein KEM52_006316 [Ascosphaera acerosa]